MAMKLEKHLVLNKYFLNLFGSNDFNELKEKLKDIQEGYDTTGRSYFVDVLIGLKPDWETELLKYDEAIKEYVERLRQNRKQPNFNLKYFQYLAVLFTEIFLDRYFNNKQNLLNELNTFLENFNNANRTEIEPFTETDLKKLAFWMATGSGKTLIMHINYWQILKYSNNIWDNIILITPNEGLSKQHYEELKISGIPSKLYDGNLDNLKTKNGEILVIDIHKLTKEKKGEGVSVDVSCFDGKNLVFIDEGHKGAGGESESGWKFLREEMAKEGFAFEYSATFGQIIEFTKKGQPKGGKSNQTNIELYNEYTKSIIFDYSYKYFYTDGYGKDFYVYNIKEDSYTKKQEDLLLIAGLLSFYEQLEIFEKHKGKLKEYNIEKPLWIFVGSKVTGKGLNSDIVKIVQFLNYITNEEDLKENIEKILNDKPDLIDKKGDSIFVDKFEYLKKFKIDNIIEGIYKKVFKGKGNIELYEIKNAEGEIGLKTSTAETYFGVINIGDIRSLKKLIKEENIEVKDDHFSQSLFFDINKSSSKINLLIGSKKFIEGWNSWRVSNMALINMGKGEGPQIIQLFGRGVRLKGKNYSLKREENPNYILKVLQTLFIFGLNADYINTFLKVLENEEVKYEEVEIPIVFNQKNNWEKKIHTLKTKEDFDFFKCPVKLEIDDDILNKIKIDLRAKITLAHGINVQTIDTANDESVNIPDEYFEVLDWNKIYEDLIDYKVTNGFYNIELIDKNLIRKIIRSNKYKLYLNESDGLEIENNKIQLKSFKGLQKLHNIVLLILKAYISRFKTIRYKQKSMDFIEVKELTVDDHLHMYPEEKKIVVKIPESYQQDLKNLKDQLKKYDPNKNQIPQEWKNWEGFVVHLDNHLYTPLIIWMNKKDEIKSFPVKLNKGETKFVEDLKDYLNQNNQNYKVFLLRNLSKRGVGFFINEGFYPDFILWIKEKNRERMIFIDPKGIRNLGTFEDDKIQFCKKTIKEIENKINKQNLELDAYILSTTNYEDAKKIFGNYPKEEFKEYKIIFQEDRNYINNIFS